MILYSTLYLILSIIAFGIWWGYATNVSYDADCDSDDYTENLAAGDMFEMCAGEGATICIVALLFTIIAGVLAIVHALFYKDENQRALV